MNGLNSKMETPTGNGGSGIRQDMTPINQRRSKNRDRRARNSSWGEEEQSRSAPRTRYNEERETGNKILKQALAKDLGEVDENDSKTELW